MLTLNQFDGQYTQTDVDVMNAAVREAIAHYGVDSADLSDKERAEIIREIENACAGFYDAELGSVNAAFENLLSDGWQRLLKSRAA